jgi:hypothetical protein
MGNSLPVHARTHRRKKKEGGEREREKNEFLLSANTLNTPAASVRRNAVHKEEVEPSERWAS